MEHKELDDDGGVGTGRLLKRRIGGLGVKGRRLQHAERLAYNDGGMLHEPSSNPATMLLGDGCNDRAYFRDDNDE